MLGDHSASQYGPGVQPIRTRQSYATADLCGAAPHHDRKSSAAVVLGTGSESGRASADDTNNPAFRWSISSNQSDHQIDHPTQHKTIRRARNVQIRRTLTTKIMFKWLSTNPWKYYYEIPNKCLWRNICQQMKLPFNRRSWEICRPICVVLTH